MDVMDKFSEIAHESLENYFSTLYTTGYLSDKKTLQLLVVLFLKEFLHSFQGFITEKDYIKIDKLLMCIQKTSCLVPYYSYIKKSKKVSQDSKPVRVSEQDLLRSLQSDTSFRITEG